MSAISPSFPVPPIDRLQATFMALVPRIETHGRVYFRNVKCPHKKQDAIAEMVAQAWKWFVRLAELGKDATQFPTALATYAARAVKSGRRLCGQEPAKDVMSGIAQQRHGFKVEALPSTTLASLEILYSTPLGQEMQDALEERLRDNSVTPVPDQAAFRIDWPRFVKTLTGRDRWLAEFLGLGHSGKKAADKFNLSPCRVTQIRQQWCREWRASQGDTVTGAGCRG